MAQWLMNLTRNHEVAGVRSLALLSELTIWHCHELCGIGPRCGSDPSLLWLRCRPAATALILPLAWKLPYAVGAALKRQKKKSI